MRRGAILGLLLAASMLAACGDSPPGAEEALATYRRLRAYLEAENYGAVFDMLASSEHERMERDLARMREEMDQAGENAEYEKKYRRLAEALNLTREELRAITPRELFIRSTRFRSKDSDVFGQYARSEVAEPPRIDGKWCAIIVHLPRGRRGDIRLVAEAGRWRLVLPRR